MASFLLKRGVLLKDQRVFFMYYFLSGENMLNSVSHRNVISLSEQAVTHVGSPLNIRKVHIYLVVVEHWNLI